MLPDGRWIRKDDPYPSVVAVLKGNTLRDLKKRYKESLFAWNIRGFLGSAGINRGMATTVREAPEDFFYFNNGVSAICTDFKIVEEKRLIAERFQIINGAQTVSTLAGEDPSADVEVLFRLTKTKSVNTEGGFNHDLIKYQNSQNPIKVSDFRSNDQIQLFLEKRLKERKATPVLKKLRYVRKRQVGRARGIGQPIKLEEMAKVRYAFLYEPTLIHATPRALWSLDGADAAYAKAFGVAGELKDSWSQADVHELFWHLPCTSESITTQSSGRMTWRSSIDSVFTRSRCLASTSETGAQDESAKNLLEMQMRSRESGKHTLRLLETWSSPSGRRQSRATRPCSPSFGHPRAGTA